MGLSGQNFVITSYSIHYTKFYEAGYFDTSLFRLPSGEIVSIYTDVTEKRIIEEDLKASEEKFRLAMVV